MNEKFHTFRRNKIINKMDKLLTEEEERAKKKQKELSEVSTSQQPRSSRVLGLDDNLESKAFENITKIIMPEDGKLKLKTQINEKFGQRFEHMVPKKKKRWNEKNIQNVFIFIYKLVWEDYCEK